MGLFMLPLLLLHTQVGPLTAKEYKERLVTSEGTQSVQLPHANSPPPPVCWLSSWLSRWL